ncbi:hypothetical protein A2714_05310 [Candidatus Woesebacteria bacterium RIFCSPHIGHO2_01_FULL_38_9]|uniref:Uncharacterized protein n=2 Tax=Candidatus Woeseibacteriota TaxID=1752722 RepID=A0A1F7Y3C5_9BACT|nr:MAG: hypothetical protein A2714_05310 [Candidatus Woesebacteria bacterium RIFCSPHIGHO2_01_FULL_38_9]OGM59078.1 MAG: hypothetical protein A3A75_05440 [Candidatus Woesebacteria bacterium RIFCSPLOWO2_01_FULL_39_10]
MAEREGAEIEIKPLVIVGDVPRDCLAAEFASKIVKEGHGVVLTDLRGLREVGSEGLQVVVNPPTPSEN